MTHSLRHYGDVTVLDWVLVSSLASCWLNNTNRKQDDSSEQLPKTSDCFPSVTERGVIQAALLLAGRDVSTNTTWPRGRCTAAQTTRGHGRGLCTKSMPPKLVKGGKNAFSKSSTCLLSQHNTEFLYKIPSWKKHPGDFNSRPFYALNRICTLYLHREKIRDWFNEVQCCRCFGASANMYSSL